MILMGGGGFIYEDENMEFFVDVAIQAPAPIFFVNSINCHDKDCLLVWRAPALKNIIARVFSFLSLFEQLCQDELS